MNQIFIYNLNKWLILIALTVTLSSCSDDEAPNSCSGEELTLNKLTMLGQIKIPGNFTADVWGYSDPATAQEYALVGDFSLEQRTGNLSIVNVTDPYNPLIEATIFDIFGFDIKVWKNYVYVSNGIHITDLVGNKGHIYDLTNPTNPQLVGFIKSSHNIFIDNEGYLYLSIDNGVEIFNLNPDPTTPKLIWSDPSNSKSHDVSVIGNRLFDFHSEDGTIIYDISDQQNPKALGTVPHIGFSHSGWVTSDGNFLYISDEGNQPDITIWDISNPANAFQVGCINDEKSGSHNIYIIDKFAYTSYYSAGLKIFDVSNPLRPVLVETFKTNQDGGFGAFGVFPFTNSGLIYVSDVNNGLFIFSFQ